jgi:hypothetical protein
MKVFRWLTAAAILGVTQMSIVQAEEASLVQQPFASGALTDVQKDAWASYIKQESGQYGCSYGDDPRLSADAAGALTKLAAGETMPPLKVTLRTYLKAGKSIQTLLRRNMYIASMDCSKVYLLDGELVGTPAIPYEEYLSILVGKMTDDPIIKNHFTFIRQVRVAAMDIRWFAPFFVLSKDGYQIIGYDHSQLMDIANQMPGEELSVKPRTAVASISSLKEFSNFAQENPLWLIYYKAFKRGSYLQSEGICEPVAAEANTEIYLDQSVIYQNVAAVNIVEGFGGNYAATNSSVSALHSTPTQKPSNQYLAANRNNSLISKECSF